MPITKSAKKALRQSLRKRAHNRQRKEALRDAIKQFKKLVAEKKIAEAQALVPRLYKTIDKAAKRGQAMKKQTAARKKSRLLALLKP